MVLVYMLYDSLQIIKKTQINSDSFDVNTHSVTLKYNSCYITWPYLSYCNLSVTEFD